MMNFFTQPLNESACPTQEMKVTNPSCVLR